LAAVTVTLVEDRSDCEVYDVTDAAGTRVARVELVKLAAPAVMFARRLPSGHIEVGWRAL
jgi:hypothetical protein